MLIDDPHSADEAAPRKEIYKSEGYQFMAAAFEVYNVLGYGMAEEIYQESLEIELSLRGISFIPRSCCCRGTRDML
jgi:hypothetical protein